MARTVVGAAVDPSRGPKRHIVIPGKPGLWSCNKSEEEMPLFAIVLLVFAGSAAVADPGHWGELAGHDHWVAGAAIALAGLAAIWGALKGKKKEPEPEEELEEEAA
ncbi:DUF6732 family protein [Cognatiyoonia sp. IB215446]|uniref:DUF6732 family protein n=1 Tax=Cognatiyoonia sp. IB215446 TaxID=3097355 RepID=UPI002A12EC0E|nr:DUF6732 family protein [Cognatiyoonia sp. IB215446]MDX8346775.1 DUF6732 family protein [Cognatiyoonia sp. IB215446]